MNSSTRARAYERVDRLGAANLDLETLFAELTRLLGRALPRDAGCWHPVDPDTLIETSFFLESMPLPGDQVVEFGYLSDDYNSFVELAGARRHSGVLSEATAGHLDRSTRYRELLRPNGIRGELRISFVIDGASWGCCSFFREAPGDFTEAERDFAHDLAPLLGRCFRAAGLHARAGGGEALAPGLLLIGPNRRVESVTAPARTWLDELGFRVTTDHDQLPFALLTVAERVRGTGAEATARVLGESGRWVQLHASPVSGGPPGRVAIILQAAPSPSIAPLISATNGLTARERELTALVLRGCGTNEIAERLYISPHTVQGHFKSIFAKTGVRSRRELVARLYVHPLG